MLIVSSILEVLLSGRPFSDKLLCGDNFSFTEKLQIVLGAPASPCSVSPHISIVCDCNVLIKANAGIVEFRVLFGICFPLVSLFCSKMQSRIRHGFGCMSASCLCDFFFF